jgi:hypothetical protein
VADSPLQVFRHALAWEPQLAEKPMKCHDLGPERPANPARSPADQSAKSFIPRSSLFDV